MKSSAFIVLLLLAALGAGCRRELPHAPRAAASAAYAPLKLTRQSHDRQVQAELALVDAAGDLPTQLDGDDPAAPQDLTHALTTAFSASQLRFARQRSDKLFAHSVDHWPPLVLEQAIQLRAVYSDAENTIRATLAMPPARLHLSFSEGAAGTTTIADAALIYARLECIAAADAISRGDAQAAVAAIARALRMTEILAAAPHLTTRLTAAIARADALGAMQRFTQSRIITADGLAQVERLLSQSLANWPGDELAWKGDRAMGLLTYEMIRQGDLLAVLTTDELAAIRRDSGVSAFAEAARRNVDADEAYYLQAMRRTIDACSLPYCDRLAAIEALEAERAALADSPDYPLIADHLLLRGIAHGQRQQAADLALVQAWSIALAIACGQSLPPPQVNPLTGENFSVHLAPDHIAVSQIDPLRPQLTVVAPLAPPARISSRRVYAIPTQPR